ncbi:MAG TPA: HAD family hydrolase [Steroidobacteraceae bacterium]|nr:HAD family hydrolase [Steroidobacteraceae bacterium]
MRAAVFLDRDGVLNRALTRAGRPYPPGSPDELEVLPGVAESLAALKAAGFCLVVVTNQPDVARGTTAAETVTAIHQRLKACLPLDGVFTCPHDDADACECRKPRPGLLHAAASRLNIDCASSFMVGDRWRDIEAGRQAGCTTLFVDRGYDEPRPSTYDHWVTCLSDATRIILDSRHRQ